MGHLFTELMRRLFALIDGIVAWAIELLYVLLIQIADTDVLGNLIYHYLGRIYTFLSVFMIFKLSLAIINYIVNPDALTDKSKGFGKVISNTVISLILLAITPNLFDAAFNLQSDILSKNVIYQIVTGHKLADRNSLEENAKEQGKSMSYAVFSSFIYPSSSSNKDASSVTIKDAIEVEECSDSDGASCLLDTEVIVKEDDDDNFVYEYKYLISTICGCAVAYMLFTFCFQAALRAVKLSFLRIIAPIPILSMIDPKKDTKQVSEWGKECMRTFLDLFIRLAAIFFALDVIHNVISNSNGVMLSFTTSEPVNGLFVRLFIIIGCLMFAKQMPSLIDSLFGTKLSSSGGFSLKKTLGELPGMGIAKAAGAGALGFAGGMAANAWATKGNWKGQGIKNGFKNVGSMFAGGMSGAARGLTSKEKNLFKAGGAGIKGAVDARNLRTDRKAVGEDGIKGWASRRVGDIDKFAGVTNDDTAKIAAQRQFGEDLWSKVDSGEYASKYDMGGNIGSEFSKAWETSDKAKEYRNKINSTLSMAKSDFQAGKAISWNGATGSAAIAALEVESAKASAAYDKATADFKEIRSMQEHKSEARYYDAYSAADDRHSAAEFAEKNVTQYSTSDKSSDSSSSNSKVEVMRATKDTTYTTSQGKQVEVKQGEKVTKSGIIIGNDSNFNKR